MSQPRVCPICGYQLLDNETTCIICGKRFDEKPQHDTYSQPQQPQYNNSNVNQEPPKTYSPVRTYSSTSANTVNRTYQSTQSYQSTSTSTTSNGKKKMPTVLKVFLIIFGIQFILPFLFGIIFVIAALFQVKTMESQISNLVNAQVETIKIDEVDIDPEDCTKKTPYANNYTNEILLMSEDKIVYLPIYLDNGNYETHLFVDMQDGWKEIRYSARDTITMKNEDEKVIIEFYLPNDSKSHPLDNIDISGGKTSISRFDDINLGGDVFQTYKVNGKYYFICEISNDYYASCEVTVYNGETDLEKIFPLAAMSKH